MTNELVTDKYSAKLIVSGGINHENECVPSISVPFLIPIYQRLYTWETVHVECLLRDLWEAFESPDENEYFIGAIVVSPCITDENSEIGQEINTGKLELIDGQQRITTLWLIASVLAIKSELSEQSRTNWKSFIAINTDTPESRIDFSGREDDKASMKTFIQNFGKGDDWLKNEAMVTARKAIVKFFDYAKKFSNQDSAKYKSDANVQAFSDYIFSKATFVITQLHSKTDKNRFFDRMNSRGIQLENHDILKAQLLRNIDSNDRPFYAKAWDLCADIHRYLPKYFNEAFDYGRTVVNNEQILTFESSVPNNKGAEIVSKAITLEDIIADKASSNNHKTNKKSQKTTTEYKNLVSFPTFLLHVLSLNSSDEKNTISLNEKKLIMQFNKFLAEPQSDQLNPKISKGRSKGFIQSLIRCRLLMDNFIVKGHIDEGDDYARWEVWSHLVGSDNKKRDKRAKKAWNSITMLQTMMYFSQDNTRAPWLTKTLKILLNYDVSTTDKRSNGLITNNDGSLFLSQIKKQDDKYATSRIGDERALTLSKKISKAINGVDDNPPKGLGTSTPHYWFYKLEYCLWELWFNESELKSAIYCSKPKILATDKGGYRMRHVTSVEHVYPQKGTFESFPKELLHRFGNLGLISVGANSSYSDKEPILKATEFKIKEGKGFIESLKLAHIFEYSLGHEQEGSLFWNASNLKNHENKMLEVLSLFHPEIEAKIQTQGI
jgi:hypothetical protein